MLNEYHMRILGTILTALCLLFVVVPHVLHADSREVEALPVVIDDKAKARDILKKTITLRNLTDRKLDVYPTVNDVVPSAGAMRFVSAQSSTDREASLANWIEISRGVIELGPGEVREVPFVIRVNMNAIPNSYHAAISFSTGSVRDATGNQDGLESVMINIEVQADIKEVLQLNKFATDNIFFSGDDVLFSYQLQNIGNKELQPKGEVRIYNRKGEEVATVDVNAEGKAIAPDELSQLASVWSAAQGFGRFKAFLNVEYGSQTASLQDTIYFWIIPWQQLLAMVAGSLIAMIVLALYVHRWLEEKHFHKLAQAGLLKPEAHPAFAGIPQGMMQPAAPMTPIAPRTPWYRRIPVPRIRLPRIPLPRVSVRWSSREAREESDPRKHAVLYKIPQASAAPVVPVPTPLTETRPSHVPMRERIPLQNTPPAQSSGTINLKNLRTHNTEPVSPQNHVINLKKPK